MLLIIMLIHYAMKPKNIVIGLLIILLVQCKMFLNAVRLKIFYSVPDQYKTPEICNKSFVAFLPTLKFVPDWFGTGKVIKNLDDDFFSNDDIIFVNEYSNNTTILLMK